MGGYKGHNQYRPSSFQEETGAKMEVQATWDHLP